MTAIEYQRIPALEALVVVDQLDAAIELAVALVCLPADHPLVVAARAAIEVRDARAALKQASLDVLGAADWSRIIRNHVPHEELQRRRFPPHGDQAEWVRRGGAA